MSRRTTTTYLLLPTITGSHGVDTLVQVRTMVLQMLGPLWICVSVDNHMVLYRHDRVKRLGLTTTAVKFYPNTTRVDLKKWWRQFHLLPFLCGDFADFRRSEGQHEGPRFFLVGRAASPKIFQPQSSEIT